MVALSSIALSRAIAGSAPFDLVGAAVGFALRWLLVCLICTVVWWAFTWFFSLRRASPRPAQSVYLLAAFALVAFAGSCLLAELGRFALRAPLPAMLVPALFPLFYYVFSDGRYVRRWSRWYVVVYIINQMGALIPSRPPSPQLERAVASAPLLFAALGVVGDVGAVTIIVLGILPQVYARFSSRYVLEAPHLRERRLDPLRAVLLVLGGAVALLIAGLFAASSPAALSPLYIVARTFFFLLATLVPVGAAYMLARSSRYDREAVINRSIVSVALTAALVGIYAACSLSLLLLIPGLNQVSSAVYLPFVLLIALIMAVAFRPLRGPIRREINRRYFRRVYDAAQVVNAFRASLALTSHLDTFSTQLVTCIENALRPREVVLWLCPVPERFVYRGSGLVAVPGPTVARSPGDPPEEQSQDTPIQLHKQAVAVASNDGDSSVEPAVSLTHSRGTGSTAPGSNLVLSHALQEELRRSPAGLGRYSLLDNDGLAAVLGSGALLVMPLTADGTLVGAVTLGTPEGTPPSYTADERALLASLLHAVAPTIQAVQWEHEQELRTRARDRLDQELQTARLIQEALLPKAVPTIAGWHLATLYQPARAVGGDFYDFLALPDGKLGLVLGDVTDKGMPAALVMATTCSMLRAVATQPSVSPGQALAHVNDVLFTELPESMFVTCFYGILDPVTGSFRFANAGQDLPCLRQEDTAVCELYATGMPLGLMPGMFYEEKEVTLRPSERVLFYSDGIVEAHSPAREMFGIPRLRDLLSGKDDGALPIPSVLRAVADFTGADWEQEDDITLVALERLLVGEDALAASDGTPVAEAATASSLRTLPAP